MILLGDLEYPNSVIAATGPDHRRDRDRDSRARASTKGWLGACIRWVCIPHTGSAVWGPGPGPGPGSDGFN